MSSGSETGHVNALIFTCIMLAPFLVWLAFIVIMGLCQAWYAHRTLVWYPKPGDIISAREEFSHRDVDGTSVTFLPNDRWMIISTEQTRLTGPFFTKRNIGIVRAMLVGNTVKVAFSWGRHSQFFYDGFGKNFHLVLSHEKEVKNELQVEEDTEHD